MFEAVHMIQTTAPQAAEVRSYHSRSGESGGRERPDKDFSSYLSKRVERDEPKDNDHSKLYTKPVAPYFNPAVSLAEKPADLFTLTDLTDQIKDIFAEFTVNEGITPVEIQASEIAGLNSGDMKVALGNMMQEIKALLPKNGETVLSLLNQQKQMPQQAIPALSTLSPSPQVLTEAQQALENGDVEGFIELIVPSIGEDIQILPVDNTADTNLLAETMAGQMIANQNVNASNNIDAMSQGDMDALAMAMNGMNVGEQDAQSGGRDAWLSKALNGESAGNALQGNGAESGFAAAMKAQNATQTGTAATEVPAPSVMPPQSPANGEIDLTGLEDALLLGSEDLDMAVLDRLGHRGMITPQVTGNGYHTQLSLNSPNAGASHPTTETIAAMIRKNASNGEKSEITIELDPPELGRLKVRLEFGSDNSVKAHLSVEKPETYMMLQRDSHVLEKALQDAGLDTSSDSLNFELSDQGTDQNGQHKNGSSEHSGFGGEEEMDGEIIESHMDWYVDSESGAVRYDLIA